MHARNSSRDSQATGSSNLREFRGDQTCENYLRTTLLELLFCFSASPPLVLSILAAKFPRIVFLGKYFYAINCSKFCLFFGELIFPALILPIVIVVLKVKNEIRRQRYAELMLEINWML